MPKLKAVVAGSRREKHYATQLTFTLIPKKEPYYTECKHYTLSVEMDDYKTPAIHYANISRIGNVDIKDIARTWIGEYFGNTVDNIRFLESS